MAVESPHKVVTLNPAAIAPDGSTCLAEVAMISDRDRPELSIVVPCYNEEANVVAMYEAVTAVAEKHVSSHEIIFIDNKSSDRTRELLREICERDRHVQAIFNNRNYGQMRSPTYGIYQARGRAVVALCCDFQDPPSLIPEMIAQWRAGAQIVLGKRRTEKAGFTITMVRKAGYALFNRFGDYPLIPGATGFGRRSSLMIPRPWPTLRPRRSSRPSPPKRWTVSALR